MPSKGNEALPIQLVNNESSIDRMWCRSCSVISYTIISNGLNTRLQREPFFKGSNYVIWLIKVETNNGASFILRKRFSEFETLHHLLLKQYPEHSVDVPSLPEKSVLRNFNAEFLNKRRKGLDWFLNSIFLNPHLSNTDILKSFILES